MSIKFTTAMIQQTMLWIKPDPRLVPEKHRGEFLRRCGALSTVIQGATVRRAAKLHAVNRRTLASIVRKAYLPQANGNLAGYRACIPFSIRMRRDAELATTPLSGHAYALDQLFAAHPDIKAMLDGYKGALPPGRLPPDLSRLLSSIRGLLTKRDCQSLWPMNTSDHGRRLFARYIKRTRRQAIVAGAPTVASSDVHVIKRLDQLFSLTPFDRVEFDAHRMDVNWRLLVPNARGELVIVPISAIWILAIIEVASSAVLGWKLVVGRSYSALHVAQCFDASMRTWEPRTLVVPGMHYAPGATMPSAMDVTVPVPMGRLTAMDNAKAHKATLPLQTWLRAHHGVLNFGLPHVPEARPHIEQFFNRLEVGAIRQVPGGFAPHRTNKSATATSEWSSNDHPVNLQALEDLLDVVITGHNASPIPARQHRTPIEILSSYRNDADYWIPCHQSQEHARALTTTCHNLRFKGSKGNGKPVHIQFLQVDYRHPELDKAWELVGTECKAIIDYEDLRTITLVDESLRELRTVVAADPWRKHRHDITMRRRIIALSRSGKLEIRGADSAISAYAAYTIAQAGNSVVAADQAAQLMQLAYGNEDVDAASWRTSENVDPQVPAKRPIAGNVTFQDVQDFK